MNRPAVLLFDLGNVLVFIHPGAFSQSLGILTQQEKARYRGGVVDLVRWYEGGRVSTDEYLDRLSALFEGRFPREELIKSMLKVIGQPVPGMEELVSRLSGIVTLGLVSNTNELHFEHCRASFPLIRTFPHTFLSYRLKCLKPDPRYYQMVLQSFDVAADRMLFIDDLGENIEGARKAGMQGLRFTSAQELEKELVRLSVFEGGQ